MYSGVIIGVIVGFIGAAFCIRLIIKVMLRNLIAAAEAEVLALIASGAELYHSSSALLDLVAIHVDDKDRERLRVMQEVIAHRYDEWKLSALEHLESHHPVSVSHGGDSWNAAMTAALKQSVPYRHRQEK